MTMTMDFGQCEHYGDLDRYCIDIRRCGGRVTHQALNMKAEVGTATVEVVDKAAFMAAFEQTKSAGFLE